jgi:tetratricopeptide (TPR) repeat protein
MLDNQGKLAEALNIYVSLHKQFPQDLQILECYGIVLLKMEQFERGLRVLDKSLQIDVQQSHIHSNRGIALQELKRYPLALASFEKSLVLDPTNADTYLNQGNVFQKIGRYEEALSSFNQAIALKPDYAEAYYNCGNAYKGLKNFDAALVCFKQALSLKADYAEAHFNHGNVLKEFKNYRGALFCYDLAIKFKANYAAAYWNKSLVLIAMANIPLGWQFYEWRFLNNELKNNLRNYPQPRLLNQDIQDKIILVYAEQGLGDLILFCRYIKLLADKGAKVVLEVPSDQLASRASGGLF